MKGPQRAAALLLAIAAGGCAVAPLTQQEPLPGVKISADRQAPASLSLGGDGSGGAVVAFVKMSHDGRQQVWARKVGSDGVLQWLAALSSPGRDQGSLKLVRARNGWYVLWKDDGPQGWRWLAQRLDSSGKAWAAPVQVTALASPHFDLSYCLAADDALIAAWNDQNRDVQAVYAGIVKLAPNGSVAWRRELGKNTPRGWYQQPQLAPDDGGGAFLSYHLIDAQDKGIVLQHFSTFGEPLWKDGADIYDVAKYKTAPLMVPDGQGGVIVVWEDGRSGNLDVYSQRVSATGQSLWKPEGLALATGQGDQSGPAAAADGHGGIFIAWVDDNQGSFWDIKAQHVNAKGELTFPAQGLAVTPSWDKQSKPTIVPDGRDNSFICWQEARSGDYGLYCQKLTLAGDTPWEKDGRPTVVSPFYEESTQLVPDWENGFIAAWGSRVKDSWEVRAQRFDPSGEPVWTNKQ